MAPFLGSPGGVGESAAQKRPGEWWRNVAPMHWTHFTPAATGLLQSLHRPVMKPCHCQRQGEKEIKRARVRERIIEGVRKEKKFEHGSKKRLCELTTSHLHCSLSLSLYLLFTAPLLTAIITIFPYLHGKKVRRKEKGGGGLCRWTQYEVNCFFCWSLGPHRSLSLSPYDPHPQKNRNALHADDSDRDAAASVCKRAHHYVLTVKKTSTDLQFKIRKKNSSPDFRHAEPRKCFKETLAENLKGWFVKSVREAGCQLSELQSVETVYFILLRLVWEKRWEARDHWLWAGCKAVESREFIPLFPPVLCSNLSLLQCAGVGEWFLQWHESFQHERTLFTIA